MANERSENTNICVLCLFGYVFASIAVISLLMFLFINKINQLENLFFSPTTIFLGPSIPSLSGFLPPALLIGCVCGAAIGHLIGRKFGKHDLFVLFSSAFWGTLLPTLFLLFHLGLPEL